jgi:hypothetical protein
MRHDYGVRLRLAVFALLFCELLLTSCARKSTASQLAPSPYSTNSSDLSADNLPRPTSRIEELSPGTQDLLRALPQIPKEIPSLEALMRSNLARYSTYINATSLRLWAATTIGKYGKPGATVRVPETDAPSYLNDRRVESNKATVDVETVAGGSVSFVRIYWYGGFGFWGILAGHDDFKPDPSRYYYIRWAPGIYVFELRE